MKLPLFVMAALLSAGAASAQNTPATATQPNTSNPNAVPSGMAPVQSDPKANVSPAEVFTKGAPSGTNGTDSPSEKRRMKRKAKGDKMKTTM